jgi:hypothetical protein
MFDHISTFVLQLSTIFGMGEINQYVVFRILLVFEHILEPFIKLVLTNAANLPHILYWSREPTSFLNPLNTTAFGPWSSIVQYYWSHFAGHPHPPIDRAFLEQALLHYCHGVRMNVIDWPLQFVAWPVIKNSELLCNIFLGYHPFSKKLLESIAHPGSLLFEVISILFTLMYSIDLKSQQRNEAVLDTAFVYKPDAVLHISELRTTADPENDHDCGRARAANDKRDSMEALALKLLDTSNFPLAHFIAFAALNQTCHGNQAGPFCKPVRLSKLSCFMPYCSVVHILGFSFGSSCTVTYLFDLLECSMSVMCFSRLIESIINDLINGCICLSFRFLKARMN